MNHGAKFWIEPIKDYVRSKGLKPRGKFGLKQVTVQPSSKADTNNVLSSRSFCHVVIGNPIIYCAKNIDQLKDEFVVGILLHEVAHMLVKEGSDPELDVDEFILENFPESGYCYADTQYGGTRRPRKAKNLECVKTEFLENLSKGYHG
jgi:hypothetical protein